MLGSSRARHTAFRGKEGRTVIWAARACEPVFCLLMGQVQLLTPVPVRTLFFLLLACEDSDRCGGGGTEPRKCSESRDCDAIRSNIRAAARWARNQDLKKRYMLQFAIFLYIACITTPHCFYSATTSNEPKGPEVLHCGSPIESLFAMVQS